MTPEAAVLAALYGRVESIPGGLPILYGAPGAEQPAEYIQVNHLPNESERLSLPAGGSIRRQGILQLTLAATPGQHEIVYVERAAGIAAHFRDQRLSSSGVIVTVYKVDIGRGGSDTARWRVPVSVYYRAI